MSLAFTGARAAIYINGEPMFFVGSINVEIESRLEEIPQLDSVLVAEYAENGHRCSFTINSFKLAPGNELGLTNSAESFGFEPEDGGPMQDLTILEEMIVQILDQTTGQPVFTMTGCKFEGGSGELSARGVWNGVWRFKAREGRGL